MSRRKRRALWLVSLLLLLGVATLTWQVLAPDVEPGVASSHRAGSASTDAVRPGDERRGRVGGAQTAGAPSVGPAAAGVDGPSLPPEPPEIRALRRQPPPDPFEDAAIGRRGGTGIGIGGIGIGGRAGGRFATPPKSARVLDAETDEPVAGAQVIGVLVRQGGEAVRRGGGGTTDEKGTFRLRVLDSTDNARFEVRVRHMRYAAHDVRDWQGDDLRLTALARATGVLVGSLRAEHGEAVQGVIVVHVRERPTPKRDVFAWADGDGVFRIEGLPPGELDVWSGTGAASRVRIVAGGVAQAEVATSLRTAVPTDDRVSVVVRVDHPMVRSGDAIRAYAGDTLHWLAAVEAGEARFRLPAGDWRIHVPLPDGAHLSREIEVARGSRVQTIALGE